MNFSYRKLEHIGLSAWVVEIARIVWQVKLRKTCFMCWLRVASEPKKMGVPKNVFDVVRDETMDYKET